MRSKLALLLTCLALLVACAPTPAPTATPGVFPSIPPQPTPTKCCATATSTPLPMPTAMLTPTPAPTSTATPVPLPTPTISPLLASRAGIQAGNAGQLAQAAQWGLGAITRQQSLREGRLVLATTSLGLYLYEAASLKRVAFFAQAAQPVLSEDQSLLAYTSPEQIGLYDLANLKPLKAPPVAAGMVVGAFSLDNRFLAVVHSSVDIDVVKLDDLSVAKLVRERTASQEPVTDGVAFSPDNQFLMTGESFRVMGAIARNVLLWNLPEQKLVWYQKSTNLSLPRNPFSPDGRHYLTLDGVTTRYHEIRFGTVLFSAVGMPSSAPFSPDGKLFFLEHKGVVTLYTAGDYPGGLVRVLVPEGPGGNAFSPDSTRFFAGSQVWTIGDWKSQPSGSVPAPQASISPAQAVQLGHYANLKGVVAGKNGEMWAWGSYDNTAYLLELTSGRLQTAAFAGARLIANLAFNPASMRFAACTDLGLEMLDMNARSRDSFTGCAPNGLVAFSPDGTRLARAAVTRVEMLDPNNGSLLNTLIEHTTNINYLGFSADSKWLGVGTVKNRENGYTQVSLWQVNPVQLVPGFRGQQIPGGGFTTGVYAMLVSLDGQWMIAQTNMLRAWRIADAEQMKYQETSAEALALSPDGSLVASAGAQGVRLWSVPGLEPLGALAGAGGVLGAGFNASGAGLVTFGADGMLRLWAAP